MAHLIDNSNHRMNDLFDPPPRRVWVKFTKDETQLLPYFVPGKRLSETERPLDPPKAKFTEARWQETCGPLPGCPPMPRPPRNHYLIL